MLCSMAYFFALVTSSCCSEVRRGRAPPSMPSRADRVPGPNATSPVWRMSYTGCNRYAGIFVSPRRTMERYCARVFLSVHASSFSNLLSTISLCFNFFTPVPFR
uniref:Putative secreted protein n=1 Tax=Anopheles triannulatus TaxID=58253 RepID=A0A2M4B2E0_9DIPT